MRLQATGSNPLIASMICPSVRLSAGIFAIIVFVVNSFNTLEMITVTIIITNMGVQRPDAFISTLGSSRDYMSICLYACFSVYAYAWSCVVFWRKFARITIARITCGLRPQVPPYNI